jgi:hypothetical protein
MPFTATLQSLIKTDDGCTTAGSLQVSSLTAKSSFDEIIPAGVLDLAPYLANFPVQIQGVIIIATNGNFTVSVDGSNFSTRKFSMFFVQVADSGAFPLKITVTAQCRIQFMAVGL